VIQKERIAPVPTMVADEIAAAYRERPPDDQVVIFGAEEDQGAVVARYGWSADEPNKQAGRMLVTPRDGKIAKLVVTFER